MSIMVATGRGALAGVLVKDAAALERLERIDTLVVDKTGTLTEGKPRLVEVVPCDGFTELQVLATAAALERGSEHPLAQAIVLAANERGVAAAAVTGFEALTGKGVVGDTRRRTRGGRQRRAARASARCPACRAGGNARRNCAPPAPRCPSS